MSRHPDPLRDLATPPTPASDGDVATWSTSAGRWVPTAPGASSSAAAIAAHEAAADPHPGYQRETEKGAANGYASLGTDGKVPSAQLPASSGGLGQDDVLALAFFGM